MAYADQQGMSSNRLISIIIVVLLHAFLGYALVTGLAYDAVKQIKAKMTVVDVEEEKPPEEEPPPEPEKQIEHGFQLVFWNIHSAIANRNNDSAAAHSAAP